MLNFLELMLFQSFILTFELVVIIVSNASPWSNCCCLDISVTFQEYQNYIDDTLILSKSFPEEGYLAIGLNHKQEE